MYASFFGFRENPFNVTPDPNYLFLSYSHHEALRITKDAITKRRGLITITGAVGTGKTLLCRYLLTTFDAATKSALIFNSSLSDEELLLTISQEFGFENSLKTPSFAALSRFLLENFHRGGNAVLLIDEAQNLSRSALKRILRLSELKDNDENLIQIILVGQPELNTILCSLKPLMERIRATYYLEPLEPNAVGKYIHHRLKVAGGRNNIRFTPGALEKIYSHTGGKPRRINAICDRALLIAYVKEKRVISKEVVSAAVRELYPQKKPKPAGFRMWIGERSVLSFVLLLFLLFTLGFGSWAIREKGLGNFPEKEEARGLRVSTPIPPYPKPSSANHLKASMIPSFTKTHHRQKAPAQRESLALVAPSNQRGTEPPRKKTDDIKPRASSETFVFSVQVGAFLVRSNAERMVGHLQDKDYEPYISRLGGYRGKEWYSVRILDCRNRKNAQRAVDEYEQKEGKSAIVTKFHSLDPA